MKKILVIEDNQLNMKLMKDILESKNYSVETAFDGSEGLKKANETDFDLILLDLQMPVVSGYDFLKAYEKTAPVAVVSACAMEAEIQKAMDLGAKCFIAKPIQLLEFLETVRELLK